ncbi:MAG: hypothetical protein ABSD49_12370 [Candidatus Bathyarchaeia archaeon]
MKILFVCSGNTCRSPMVEGLARKMLGRFLLFKAELLKIPFQSRIRNMFAFSQFP